MKTSKASPKVKPKGKPKTAPKGKAKAPRKRARSSTVLSGKFSGKGERRGRVENLTPWPPGVSGNPGGKPRKALALLSHAYTDVLKRSMPRDMAAEVVQAIADGATVAEVIALSMVQYAARGDVQSAREIRTATEGEKQTHEFIDPSAARDELARRIAELAERRRSGALAQEPQ